MAEKRNVPRRLFKYRAFNNLTLDMIIADNLFYADPSTFNDPLDTRPSLNTDLPATDLERALRQLVERRVSAEMKAAAKTIRYKGPKTLDHIDRLSRLQADRIISEISYNATDPSYEIDDPLQFLLGSYLEKELLLQYDKGIVSMGQRATCPLMWSHYGDQHHGVCIGYSVPSDAHDDLHKVKYGGTRLVDASKVLAMLDGDKDARRQVDEAVLLRKAASWRYEQEWRLIGPRGVQRSLLELEEVIFGMRCKEAVKYAIVTALDGRRRPVRFYEMRELHGTFNLKKYPLDDGEMRAFFPRRSRDIHEAFQSAAASYAEGQSS
ncbi:hypothetical protein XI03_09255 [Bradyrhizobium sp. CCBAU 65884]|uniref:DUF2971 domain-containing protein n=1 Tax=Bradyrhizobium sp. CCBAU 65884 TaxID=722477 RepID=UPI0023067BB6|nr:DUF2971 domain-containing protein [Bradyrhizobium sp. CCBAU 65884]MDA9474689.1 hypothetical protein [Bradyrhizobium sp. CCBAU 65884]